MHSLQQTPSSLQIQTQNEHIIQPSLQILYQDNQQQKHYGKMIPILKNQHQQPKYMLGPHYFVFIPALLLCTWFLIYALQIFYQKLQFNLIPMILCSLSALFFIISYFRVGFSNPGIASTTKLPNLHQRMDSKYCQPCKVLKIDQTRHCFFCDVCILQMDHHCIWVGKCIGRDNLILFKLFMLSAVLLMLIFAICICFCAKTTHPTIK